MAAARMAARAAVKEVPISATYCCHNCPSQPQTTNVPQMPWLRPHTSVGGAWCEHNHPAGPCGTAKILDFRCQNIKIIEKSRAARARIHTKPDQYQELALANAKSEDPAKMTYSIPDFLSRNTINTPIYCPIFREMLTNLQYQYLESCESIF